MFNDLVKKKFHGVNDIHGKEITPGCKVLVHQTEGIREAIVIEVFSDRRTLQSPGFWVDIDAGDGIEGIMSYILEVI